MIKVPIDLFDFDGELVAGVTAPTLLVATNYGTLATATGVWTAQGGGHYVYMASIGEEAAAQGNLIVDVAASGSYRAAWGRWSPPPSITLGEGSITEDTIDMSVVSKIAKGVGDRMVITSRSMTADDVTRLLAAIEAGPVGDFETGILVFKNFDGSVACTIDTNLHGRSSFTLGTVVDY